MKFGHAKGAGLMRALGRHVLAEAYECDPAILDDVNLVESILVEAALAAGAEVRQVAFHKFAPQGVSGVVVISESHLTIHTWPELGYAAIDVFTCGDHVDPWEACHYIFEHLRAGRVAATETKRGILDADASHQFEQLQPVALRRDAAG